MYFPEYSGISLILLIERVTPEELQGDELILFTDSNWEPQPG